MKIPVQTVFRAVVAVILFSLVGAIDHVAAQSSPATEDAAVIILQRPRVHPESRANREAIETSLLQAAAHLSRTNPRVAVVPEWAAAEASGSDIRGSGGTTKIAPGSAGDPEGGVGRGTPPRSARPRDTYRLTVDAIHDPTTPTIALAISGTGNTAGRQASAIPCRTRGTGTSTVRLHSRSSTYGRRLRDSRPSRRRARRSSSTSFPSRSSSDRPSRSVERLSIPTRRHPCLMAGSSLVRLARQSIWDPTFGCSVFPDAHSLNRVTTPPP
jgi:hypothetical protein